LNEPIDVVEVTDPGRLGELEADWRRLAESGDATPFQTWEWISLWWKHHGTGRPWVLVAKSNGTVVGLMPLVVTWYRGAPLRQVRWMGAPLSDYQDILATPSLKGACTRAFVAHLEASRDRWDICDLNDLRMGTPLTEPLAGNLRAQLVFHRKCPVITLGTNWDVYLKTLGKNLRANVGRRRRQLEKAFKAELETVGAEHLHQSMEDLYRLHNTRWRKRGASGAFSGAKLQAFHHEVARAFLARGWLKLHRLVLDGRTAAAFYCFQLGGRVYYYLSGFDHAVGKYSPGNVMMAYALERAIADGAREFDLLRGDEGYKYQWKAEDRETRRLILGHASFRSRFAASGHAFERWVEHEGLKVQRRLWGRREAPGPESARLPESDGN
jgi:CelD/BcsL family acetyltransferase involved in cellulose biosynthesis